MAEQTIVVTGSKGGGGTTTVALNLSVCLAQLTKKRVGLLEFARPFGQIALMLNFEPRFTLLDALGRGDRLDAGLLAGLMTHHKSGVDILAGAPHVALRVEQRPLITLDGMLRILELGREAFELIVVDLGFVNVAEWAKIFDSADTPLLVAEPSALALEMLERYLKAMQPAGLDCKRFRIIINRSRQNDKEAIEQSEKALKQSFFAKLPNDFRQVSDAVTLGIPLTSGSNNPLAGRYRDFAARLLMSKGNNEPEAVNEQITASGSRRNF
jgi:pilus assembly protein CpaE